MCIAYRYFLKNRLDTLTFVKSVRNHSTKSINIKIIIISVILRSIDLCFFWYITLIQCRNQTGKHKIVGMLRNLHSECISMKESVIQYQIMNDRWKYDQKVSDSSKPALLPLFFKLKTAYTAYSYCCCFILFGHKFFLQKCWYSL